ncbi:MAG: hypothetical protein ACRC6B_00230 [Fusobacteriaceae bacterium]
MKIRTNKFGYVTDYCTVGDMDNSIAVNTKSVIDLDRYFNYQFDGANFILNPVPKNKPTDMAKAMYDGEKWVEVGTPDEIQNKAMEIYKEELSLVNLAYAEMICGVISEVQFDEIKNYVANINPLNTKKISDITRPSLLSKYVTKK